MGRLIYLFAAVLMAGSLTRAQSSPMHIPALAGETVFAHTNTNVLLTGETLYCKFYCLNTDNKMPSEISKILYVELVGSDHKSVFRHKMLLQDGFAHSDFFMPSSLPTGNYKLIAYTKWMVGNSATDFFETDLRIINPFRENDGKEMPNTVHPIISNSGNELPGLFSLQTDKKTYAQRDKVRLNITALNQSGKGHYSLSICRMDSLPHPRQSRPQDVAASKTNPNPASKNGFSTLPELRGEIVSGHIVSKKGAKDLKDKMVALSMPGKSFAFKLVGTDRSGKFNFILDALPYNPEMVIQVMENDRQDYSIVVDENTRPDLSGLNFSPAFALNPLLKKTIEQRSVASQIENAYYDRKKDSVPPPLDKAPFFHPLQKQYVLDDYTRFPTFKETIVEVLKELYFKRDKDHYSVHVRNMSIDAEIYGLPLVLVDGLLIQDTDALFDYPTKNIYKVDLINNPYIFGPKTFSGVISIVTKNNDFESKTAGDFIKKIRFQNPLPEKRYFAPDYSKPGTSRIPDYRNQLLWMPETALENKENAVSFYTSDVPGTFEIVLEGFTDTGIPVWVTETIEVK